MSDETGSIRVVLWDKSCSLLKRENLILGKQVKVIDGYTKINNYYGKNEVEIHFGKFSKLEI
ncbi:MAG TPA: hypothetical protein ENI29_17615 [bacterium]|nr:hypothetical protein [bacterium]